MAQHPPLRLLALARSSATLALALGMALTAVTVSPRVAGAAIHDVNVQNFSFSPKDLVIDDGDTVRWHWISGAHTASSGTSPGDVNANVIFDGPLNSTDTLYEVTLSGIATGDPVLIPYHCIPHWFAGMTGTITVNPPPPTVHEVNVQNFSFSPQDIVINDGETVRWIWLSGSHTATNGTSPSDPNGAGDIFDGILDSGTPQFETILSGIATSNPVIVPYHCIPHWFVGMTGTITVNPPPLPPAATHTITVRNFEFDPDLVVIDPGDTVRWVWESGDHTTTNGAGSAPGLNAGNLWDEVIDSLNPSFDYVFADTAGIFGFFCRPHELLDMRGTVVVGNNVSGIPGGGSEPAARLEFQQPFPNPTGGISTMIFNLAAPAAVTMEVFDLSGRLVRSLIDEPQSAGFHVIRWDGRDRRGHAVGSGIFFVRLRAGNATESRKIFRAEVPNHGH